MSTGRRNDLFMNLDEPDLARKWEALRRSGDPYAFYAIFGEEDEIAPAPHVAKHDSSPAVTANVLSKKAFQDGCRRIFRQYVPQAEGQVLRPQYRDFILRNEERPPEERAQLLKVLSRYDISTSGNLKPHLNREQEILTASKLRQIEKEALVK
jgi:hypothetical protein